MGLGFRVSQALVYNKVDLEDFPKFGALFGGGPYHKDYGISGSTLGYPYLGKLPIRSSNNPCRQPALGHGV